MEIEIIRIIRILLEFRILNQLIRFDKICSVVYHTIT